MVPHFESYLTGYPLGDAGYYAFARTWYAPEMERPGCVWTQTLLIQFADLAHIRNLSILEPYFLRPTRDSAKQPTHAIVLSAAGTPDESEPSDVTDALFALYGYPDRPILWPAISARANERALLDIWSQQWPRLRRTFRFCSGALGARESSSSSFDLQVVPATLTATMLRGIPSAVPLVNHDASHFPPWLSAAISDLHVPGAIRSFLWDFAADATGGRELFVPLVECYVALRAVRRQEDTPDSLAGLVARLFPSANDGRRLKAALFGPTDGPLDDLGLLAAVARMPFQTSFDPADLEIPHRVSNLYSAPSFHDSLFRVGEEVTSHDTPIASALLSAIAHTVAIDEIPAISSDYPALTRALLQLDPRFATSSDTWRCNTGTQSVLVGAISTRLGRDPHFSASVLEAMLSAGAYSSIASAADLVGGHAVARAVLSHVSTHNTFDAKELRRYLRGLPPSELVQWFLSLTAPNTASVEALQEAVDPTAAEVMNTRSGTWLVMLERLEPSTLSSDAMAFFCAFAIRQQDAAASDLVALSFRSVYEALAQRCLAERSWLWFVDKVPRYPEWDRCLRLVQGVLETFAEGDWSTAALARTLEPPAAFRQVLELRPYVYGRTWKLLKRLVSDIRDGEIGASRAQWEMIERFW